jgi:hypothetical protein
MTGTEIDTRRPVRRLLGWLAVVLAAVTLVLFVAGVWNPGDLVVLWKFFRNPMKGGALFFALATLASWLLTPVQTEARQSTRVRWRVTFVLGLLASLIAWGLFGPRLAHTYVEIARSGDRAVVLYDASTEDQRLHLWVGNGLFQRDAGDLGHPCGSTKASFTGSDVLHVSTAYGEFDLHLDAATGKPKDALGPTCTG